jgi:hypothetical protein
MLKQFPERKVACIARRFFDRGHCSHLTILATEGDASRTPIALSTIDQRLMVVIMKQGVNKKPGNPTQAVSPCVYVVKASNEMI